MTNPKSGSGVAGNAITKNNERRQHEATQSRQENLLDVAGKFGHGALFTILTLIGITLLTQDISFTWLLLTAFAIYQSGKLISSGSLGKILNHGEKITSAFATVIVISALLSSGFATWTASKLDGLETSASCAVDATQEKCRKIREETRRQQTVTRRSTARYATQTVSRPIVEKCDWEYANTANCEKVTFPRGAVYQREAKHRKCITNNAKDVVDRVRLGGNLWAYTTKVAGVTVYFYDLAVGEKFDGATCG
jgi:hypothetical protein